MLSADTAAIVAALRAVPGVADARIEPADDGADGMLHLILEEGSDDALVTDRVTELLRSGFGLGVDVARIQLLNDPEPARGRQPVRSPWPAATAQRAPDAGSRLVIERVQLRSAGLEAQCAVTLGLSGRTAMGEATGVASRSGMLRAVSAATLRAVEALAGSPVRLEIEHLELIVTGAESTVVVWLTMLTGSGTTRLTGAAAVRQDVRQAVVRATLDALNRRLGPLLLEADPAR